MRGWLRKPSQQLSTRGIESPLTSLGRQPAIVITIYFDNSAFNGNDCGRELARILQIVTDRVDLESKSDLIRGDHDDPKPLFDSNGNRVGSMEIGND